MNDKKYNAKPPRSLKELLLDLEVKSASSEATPQELKKQWLVDGLNEVSQHDFELITDTLYHVYIKKIAPDGGDIDRVTGETILRLSQAVKDLNETARQAQISVDRANSPLLDDLMDDKENE